MDDKKPYQGTRARKRQRLVAREPLAANSSEDAKPDPTPRVVPLARVVDKFIKPRYPRGPVHWRALRGLLFLLKYGSTNSDQHDPEIVGALDQEWWTGNPHDTFLPKIKYTLFLRALEQEGTPDYGTFKDRLTALKNLASDKDLTFLDHRYDDSLESIQFDFGDLMENAYHRNIIQLFKAEFYPSQDPSDVNQSRHIAGRIAAEERISIHSTPASISFSRTRYQLKCFPRSIPSAIKPCHWLEDREMDGLPFYLWDIEQGCTVRTADIRKTHIFYAIKMERVVGVEWLVPKIRRYDVKELPQMIRDAGFSEPYLWLDLFCIPQETKKISHLEILNAELPRQLAIFRNASTVVMCAIAWLGLKLLSRDSTNATRYQDLSLCFCDFVLVEEEKNIIPPAWFESLWTLQEISIRPDMAVLDRDWRALTIGNSLLLTLDSLSSLVVGVGDVDGSPKGVATLISVHDEYIRFLVDQNRLDPMVMGAHRVSTSSRAPAIMSAVGATDWFHGRTLQQFRTPEEEYELVLNSYPFDFVEEVRELSGAAFFSCSTNVATLVLHDDTGIESISRYPLVGTMLPFMPLPDRDGSVILSRVAIIASNSIKLPTSCELECEIRSNDPRDATSRHTVILQSTLALNDWICEFRGETHAICTMFSKERMTGIILHRIKTSDSFISLIKAGVFEYGWPSNPPPENSIDPGFITVRDVYWRVL
ncbi:hypothetical protein BJX66DRAFT_350520 [Aspergillus keveii]|uniref:Heterokaryon incompatibility domain-containing protein n=1 Tax=Aspergillus keveii TaxID=714993 RepID=A0ABR4G920_9EURO